MHGHGRDRGKTGEALPGHGRDQGRATLCGLLLVFTCKVTAVTDPVKPRHPLITPVSTKKREEKQWTEESTACVTPVTIPVPTLVPPVIAWQLKKANRNLDHGRD